MPVGTLLGGTVVVGRVAYAAPIPIAATRATTLANATTLLVVIPTMDPSFLPIVRVADGSMGILRSGPERPLWRG